MKTKKCENIMEEFMMLDKNERLPLKLTLHLLACKECRTQVRYLSLAEKYAAEHLKASVEFRIKPVSMSKWIVCGILMIAFMLMFGTISDKINNQSLTTTFYIVFGLIVTAYCAVFMGQNLDFFVKKINSKDFLG